ncbi:hypothetical protein J7J18_06935 [bacterium]|nr:hypothetical protein [bacterium]
MAEEYIVEIGVENKEELEKLRTQVAKTAESVQTLSETVRKLAESQRQLVESIRNTARSTQASVKSTQSASKATSQYASSVLTLRTAFIAIASAAGLVTAAINSKKISMSLANKLYVLYTRSAQSAARAVTSFAVQHRFLGTVLTQTVHILSTTTSAWITWAKGSIPATAAMKQSLNSVRDALRVLFTEFRRGPFTWIASQFTHVAEVGKSAFVSIAVYAVRAATRLVEFLTPAVATVTRLFLKLSDSLTPVREALSRLFVRLRIPDAFTKLTEVFTRLKVIIVDVADVISTKFVSGLRVVADLWKGLLRLAYSLRDRVAQIGSVVKSKLAGKIGLTASFAFLGTVLDKVRDKILQLGARINESLGGEAVSIGAKLSKPFVAMMGSLTILSGKLLRFFPLTKKLGSTLTTLGYSLASVSSFSRSWSMVMSHLDKTLPGVNDRLRRVTRGFSELTGKINIQTAALPRLIKALGEVTFHYLMIFKFNVSLAHGFELLGEKLSYFGEAMLEHFSESYRVSSEMIRTQVDLNRAVRRYAELTGDASMSAKDWLQWSDRLALSAGKNVSEMRRVTGALLDFAALYKLNQKETKRFISLMTDVSSFLGKDVFETLQHVHGALAGLTNSAMILGINIDHLREKTKFYEEQLRKEGTETGKSVKQKARMLALIQELSYLQGVNNRLMETGYGILRRYRVSQELLAAQTGNYVTPILNAYYKILTRINEVMAQPGIGGFITTMKAAGAASLDLLGRFVKLGAQLFVLIETVHLVEKALTALNAAFDVFGMTQRTALAPLFVMRDGMVKTSFTASSLSKVLKRLSVYIGTTFVNFFKNGAKAVKGLVVELRTAISTLMATKVPKAIFGPALASAMVPERGVIRKALAASKLMQATFMAEGLVLAKKVTPMVQKHAKQVRDLYLITHDVAGAQREWANTIITFTGAAGGLSKVWYTFLGVVTKVKGAVLKLINIFKGFAKIFGIILIVIPAVYKAFKEALIPAFKETFGESETFRAAVSALGKVLGWLGKIIVQIVTGPVKLFATGIAGTAGVISYALGLIIKYRGVLLRLTGPFYLLGKSVFNVGKWFGIWGKSVDSLNKKLDSAGETLIKFGERSADNARAIIGLNKVLQTNIDRTARLRKELAEGMKRRQEELGLNLSSAKSLERVVNAIQEYRDAYQEFLEVQDEIEKGRTTEGKQLEDAEALHRRSTEAVQELSKARSALAENLKKQFEITGAQIKETKTLVSLYSKYTKAIGDVSTGQVVTLKTGQAISRIWQGLNQITQGNLSGIKTTAEAYNSLAGILRDMASKASPSLRAALVAEAKSYEKQAGILTKVMERTKGKVKIDEKLIETSFKVSAAQRAVNDELQRHQAILTYLHKSISDTTEGLGQFANVYSKDVTVSAETAARVQLALAKISEVGARRYEEAINGNIDSLKVYRNYLETIQKSQNDEFATLVKDAKGRQLLNAYLEAQIRTVDNLIKSYESESQVHVTLSARIKARLATLKAQNKVTTETLKLRKLLLDLWKSEFNLHSRLNALTLQGLTTREKRAQAEQYLSEALQQSIEQYSRAGLSLKAFDDYEKGAISTTTAVRQALVQLQGRTDLLSRAIKETLLEALSRATSQQREYAAMTIQSARRIKELEKVIHPVYTTFGNYSNLIADLVNRSRDLAKQTGISALAFDSSTVTVSELASYLALLSAHQVDYNNVSKETAQEVTSLVEKLLELTRVDVPQWGSSLANVFESLQGKTKDFISANDYLKPALLNAIFGFRGLVDRVRELDANLAPVIQSVLDSASAMYEAKSSSSAYSEGLSKITSLEEQVRTALSSVLPHLNAQVQALAKGKVQTADMIAKTQDYARIVSILVSQLNTLTDAEERLRESRRKNLELSSSLVFSTQQLHENVSELANIAVQDLIQQYRRAGVVLSESQKQALEDITRTITGYTELTELARRRVDTFTKFVDAKLAEQTRAWSRNKDEVEAFANGLRTIGESAMQGILKNYAEIGAKIEEMGGFFGALGQMTQEAVARTAASAFDELNRAIIDSIVYGKRFQMNWQEILRSFTAGLAQAMLQLLEFKLAMMALQAMGIRVPMMRRGGLVPLRRQAGGPVPGQGRGDSVPALLEPGEYVVPRPVVEKIGVSFFDALRKGVVPPTITPFHYQAGGLVTPMQQQTQEPKVTVVTIFDEKELNKYYSSPTYGRVVANNVGERIARRTS